MTTTALITEQAAKQTQFTREQIELIKRTICVGATDDELTLFTMQAQRMGLDPFARQIHAVKRKAWNPDTRETEDRMSIQVGIDGYRLVADRTGRYSPGRANTYEYDANGRLLSATAYVQKLVANEWHECAATAHMSEYAQTKKDGTYTAMWASKPHIMLGKCAESLALRRAFPAELSGVYTDDEMAQADSVVESTARQPEPPKPDKPAPVPPETTAEAGEFGKALEAWKKAANLARSIGYEVEKSPHKATTKDTAETLREKTAALQAEFDKFNAAIDAEKAQPEAA